MSKNSNPPIWVSQNFLTSTKTINRLIKKTSITSDDYVVEIGPGKGHITRALVKHCKKLAAIELDKSLFDKLQIKYSAFENLELYRQDFLKWKLPATGKYKIFANIPFNHTTNIIRKLAESPNPPTDAWLIVEKGAAKRMMGSPRESGLSLMLKPVFDIRIVYHFKREDFHPMPGVDVVMIHISKKLVLDIPQTQMKSYRRFIAAAVKNNGTGLRGIFTGKQLTRACREAGVSDIVSGEILYIQWLCLFRSYRMYACMRG